MDIVERDDPPLDAKLAEPIVWGKVAGLTAQELKPDLFDECLKLVKRYLIPEEAMCVALDMQADKEGCASLLANAKECMRDGTSIVILKGDDYEDEEGEEGEDEREEGLLEGHGGEQALSKSKEAVEGGREDGKGELPEQEKGSDVANGAEEALASATENTDVQEASVGVGEKGGQAEKEEIVEGGENENAVKNEDDEKEIRQSLIDSGLRTDGTGQGPTDYENEKEETEGEGQEEGVEKGDNREKGKNEEVEEGGEEGEKGEELKEHEVSEEDRRKKKREKRRRRHKRRERERRKRAAEEEDGEGEGEGDEEVKEEKNEGDEEKEDEPEDDADESRVVAVMVARVVQRLEHMRSFSRIKVVQGEAYQKWLALRCHLQKTANLFDEFDVDTYYRLYHIVVHPDHRKKGVGSFLVRLAAQRLAGLFAGPGATVCTAVAPSRATQRLLARQGFRPQVLLNYHDWKDDQGQQVISGAGVGNYNVALTVYEVSPRAEGEPPDVTPLLESTEEAEEEPGAPTVFPGRELGLDKPPAPECPPAHEEPPFAVAVAVAPRPPSAPPCDPADPESGGETDSSSSSSSGSRSSVVEGTRSSGSTEPSA